MLVEAAGGTVLIHPVAEQNLKVTTPLDLRVAELLLGDRAGADCSVPQQDADQSRREAELADAEGGAEVDRPEQRAMAVPTAKAEQEEQRADGSFGAKSMLAPMLTDYHLHLRPDEDGTTLERYFTAENVERYLAAAAAAGIEELGRLRARLPLPPGARALAATRSGSRTAVDDLDAYCEFVRGTPLRLGIECDYVPGAEERTDGAAGRARLRLRRRLGPLHRRRRRRGRPRRLRRLGGRAATPTRSGAATSRRSPTAARSGLFDILAHPDLVKVWGRARPLPERDLRAFYEPAVEAIAESGIAVEISTAGLRKPVGELYPSRQFAEMCVEAGAAFALSSDAHLPEQVGFEYERAVEFLDELGIGEICVFEQRRRSLAPLGSRVR